MKHQIRWGAIVCSFALMISSCGQSDLLQESEGSSAADWIGAAFDHRMELTYADQFTIDYYGEDYVLLTIADTVTYLVVAEGAAVPEHPDDVVILQQPFDHIYMATSSAMDFFNALSALPKVEMTSTAYENWDSAQVKAALEAEEMYHIGKYSAPDYEALMELECDLAVENTMIYHTPETKEKIEQIGIPVIVEHSSYESHPLGRMEWIKVYGMLLGMEDEAADVFSGKVDAVESLIASVSETSKAPTVAFFYMTSDGSIVIRRPGDYVAKMIDLMGGDYIFSELVPDDDSATSTMKLQMEEFYALASTADILIYNTSIAGDLGSMDDLMALSGLFEKFKAVQNGQVYCADGNMFQSTMAVGDIMQDFYQIFHGKDQDLTYLYLLSE